MKSNRREGANVTETRKVPGDERRQTANQGGPGEMEVEGRPGVSTARSARPTRAAGVGLIRLSYRSAKIQRPILFRSLPRPCLSTAMFRRALVPLRPSSLPRPSLNYLTVRHASLNSAIERGLRSSRPVDRTGRRYPRNRGRRDTPKEEPTSDGFDEEEFIRSGLTPSMMRSSQRPPDEGNPS